MKYKDKGFGHGSKGGGSQPVRRDPKRQESGGEARTKINPKRGPHK